MAEDLRITRVPFIKDILISELNNYLKNQININSLFRNFKNIRVGEDHPFAKLISSELGLQDSGSFSATDLFPSITVVITNDKYASRRSELHPIANAEVGAVEIAHMRQNKQIEYIISDAEIDRIETALNTIGGDDPQISFEGRSQPREASVAIEIWSRNSKIKDRLYDLITAFFATFGSLSLRETYCIVLDNDSLTGEKDGVYNFDFGYRLSGAMIRFQLDYEIRQFRAPPVPVIGRQVIVESCDTD